MARPVLIIGGLVLVIVAGLALATIAPTLGTILGVGGIVLLGLYLAGVLVYAWSGDQKRFFDPGSLRREYLEERKARQSEQAAAQDEPPK